MKTIHFDIETGPLPEAELAVMVPAFDAAEVKMGNLKDGTAIGEGIATAVNRMKTSKAKSKVMILLTDGDNNRGEIDPIPAAQLAAAYQEVSSLVDATFGNAISTIEESMLSEADLYQRRREQIAGFQSAGAAAIEQLFSTRIQTTPLSRASRSPPGR